jgi:hypothetical protein
MDPSGFLLTYIKLAGKMKVKSQHYLLAESEEGHRECHCEEFPMKSERTKSRHGRDHAPAAWAER